MSKLELIPGGMEAEPVQNKIKTALNKIKEHPAWQEKVVGVFWKNLPEADKKALYERGAPPGIIEAIKKTLLDMNPITKGVSNVMNYKDTELKMFGDQLAPTARALMQMDLLPAPEKLSSEEMIHDVIQDQKNVEQLLTAVRVLVKLFAPECTAQLNEAETVAKAVYGAKTKIAEEQQLDQLAA